MPRALDLEITDFAQSIGLLMRRVRASTASQELSWTESAILKRLAQDGSATTADLARTQGMRPQSMRTILTTLEKMGMIERKPHATDGRQVNIVLTPKGIAEQKATGDAKRTWLTQSFARLTETEQQKLFEAGRILRRLLEDVPR